MLKKIGSYIFVFILGVGIACAGIYLYVSGLPDNTGQFNSDRESQNRIVHDLAEHFSNADRRDADVEELIQEYTKGTTDRARRGIEITEKIIELERANITELQELKRKIQALETME